MRSYLLIFLFLCCLLVALGLSSDSQPWKKAERRVNERDKRASSGNSVSRRSLQFTSNFRSSDCSQQKEVPRNCYHAKLLGHSISGVYEIDPRDDLGSFKVYCDMQTDGGGWTVVQRRKDGSENFYRKWGDYKEGFGKLYGEFWLGLDKIHRLVVSGVTLRVDLMATDNSKAYAKYEDFTIGDENSLYVMYLGRYTGTAGDSMTYNNNMKFSTYDRDNDKSSRNCASSSYNYGAWWYYTCSFVNLNGRYVYGGSSATYVFWNAFKSRYSLKGVEMKLK